MTAPLDNWRPTPELLAAYFDGECEGRDDLALLRQRIEDWIAAHPDAHEELAAQRRLRHLWQRTTPAEPSSVRWASMFGRLESFLPAYDGKAGKAKTAAKRRDRWLLLRVAMTAAGVIICLNWTAPRRETNRPVMVSRNAVDAGVAAAHEAADDEVLQVAHANEVTIVRVEGADIHTLVVGELPLQGSMQLAAPGDVVLTLIRPDPKESVNPVRLIEGAAPMIWAKLASETDD